MRVFEADFDVKKELTPERMLRSEEMVWNINNQAISIYDRKALLDFRQSAIEDKNWQSVKTSNQVLLELDFLEKRIIMDAYPSTLQIEHSSFCNAECIMCSHAFTKNHNAHNLSLELFSKIEYLLPYVVNVTLHGVGEAFINTNITHFIDKYHEYDIKLNGNTNASVMSTAVTDAIAKSFSSISVSCDAGTAYTYEHIRKGLKFETFKENVIILREAAPRLHIRMATVIMRQNILELEEIVRLASELQFDDIIFTDVTTQKLLGNEKDGIQYYRASLKENIEKAKKMGKKLHINVIVPNILCFEDDSNCKTDELDVQAEPMYKKSEFYERLHTKYSHFDSEPHIVATMENYVVASKYACEGICDHLLEKPFIDSEGNVFPCCIDWVHTLGNIKNSDFEGIWNGEVIQGIRKMFYSGKLPKYCVGCIFLRNQINCKRIKILNMDRDFNCNSFDDIIVNI